jgi:hypothetical protein
VLKNGPPSVRLRSNIPAIMTLPTIVLLVLVIFLSFIVVLLLPDGYHQVLVVKSQKFFKWFKETLLKLSVRRIIGGLSICVLLLLIVRSINSKPGRLSMEAVDADHHAKTSKFAAVYINNKPQNKKGDHETTTMRQSTTSTSKKEKEGKQYPTPECKPRSARPGDGRLLKPGEFLYDDSGNLIHAHGGGIMVPKQAGAPHTRCMWRKIDHTYTKNIYSFLSFCQEGVH